MKKKLPLLLLVLLLLATLAGQMGKFHWILDLFSHFTLHYALLGAALAIIFLWDRRYSMAALALLLVMFHGYRLAELFHLREEVRIINAETGMNDLHILQYNLNHFLNDPSRQQQWLLENYRNYDVIFLFEGNKKWDAVLKQIAAYFPAYFTAPIRGHRHISVFSNLPESSIEMRFVPQTSIAYVTLTAKYGAQQAPVVLMGIHPPPPVTPDRAEKLKMVLKETAERMAALHAPYKIMVGDFNSTRWSPHYRAVQQKTGLYDSFNGFGLAGTWPSFIPAWLAIPIDNLLLSENIKVVAKEIGPYLALDHRPVMTTLRLQ